MRLRTAMTAFVLTGLVLSLADSSLAESRRRRSSRPITKSKFDPEAKKVDLFDAVDQELIDVKLIAKDSTGGNVFIENKTNQALNVKLPESFVGVPVLKQGFGGLGPGAGGVGGGFPGGGIGGGGFNQTGSQPLGGGFGGGLGGGGLGGGLGGGGLGGGGLGGNFFSIPAEKIAKVEFQSVCLAHGRPEPRPQTKYRLVRVKDVSSNAVLEQLLRLVGNKQIDQKSAQAAAWHLVDKMSWQQLAAERVTRAGGLPPTPFFSPAQLHFGHQLLATAQNMAKNAPVPPADAAEPAGPVVRSRRIR